MAGCCAFVFLIITIACAGMMLSDKATMDEKIKELSELEAKRKKTDRAAINEMREEKEWREMSPEPLFKRLEEAQELVAKSSYETEVIKHLQFSA